MMTQVDEIFNKRHLEMSFIEFLEAFARVCDKANLQPDDTGGEDDPPLNVRIRRAMVPVVERVCSVHFKRHFNHPSDLDIDSFRYKRQLPVLGKFINMLALSNKLK